VPDADASAITASPVPELLTEEDEDDWGQDGDEEDLEGEPDPFIRGTAPEIDFHAADVRAMRAKARADALSGEHRLLLSSTAGPGSLAEALNSLVAEGRVEAEFVDDPLDGPAMIFRPIAPEGPPGATNSPQTQDPTGEPRRQAKVS
jgi:hypothetical protein